MLRVPLRDRALRSVGRLRASMHLHRDRNDKMGSVRPERWCGVRMRERGRRFFVAESLQFKSVRCSTNGEYGNGTIFDEVATFHSAVLDRQSGCFWRCRRLEFAFSLQPIIEFITCLAATLEIDFIRAQPDFFPTVFVVCGSILNV